MRSQLLKLQKHNSTKGERRIGEFLKRNRIKFKCKWKVGPYEIDFLVGRVAIEVDGEVHRETNTKKDTYLASKGLVPIHIRTEGRDMGAVGEELIHLIKANND